MWLAKVQTVVPRTNDNWATTPPWATEKLKAECEANANLISAAPDLYEACEKCLCVWDEDNGPEMQWALEMRAALAKARGEA